MTDFQDIRIPHCRKRVARRHDVCVSAEPLYYATTARHISLGGEGNALYPVLSNLKYATSEQVEQRRLGTPIYIIHSGAFFRNDSL